MLVNTVDGVDVDVKEVWIMFGVGEQVDCVDLGVKEVWIMFVGEHCRLC